jgi:hypothetical protein
MKVSCLNDVGGGWMGGVGESMLANARVRRSVSSKHGQVAFTLVQQTLLLTHADVQRVAVMMLVGSTYRVPSNVYTCISLNTAFTERTPGHLSL